MNKNVEWLTEKDSVRKAASVMAEAGVGFLPICDAQHRVIGVVTDRDLTTRVLAKNVDPDTTSAALVMSSPALTFLQTAEVSDAEALMASERKARLVIIDAEEKLTGVLDLADIVESAPGRQSLQTVRAIMWREALGPRGGAPRGQPLLKDDPAAQNLPAPPDEAKVLPTVFVGAHRGTDTKEFPG
jgi:signal-transduction protein with cAMP-binding, CBS, and nucleotidyltransferase domain